MTYKLQPKPDYVTKSEFKKEVRGLHQKIDNSVKKLDTKIDDSVKRLEAKIDDSVNRLDDKIDSSVKRLDEKINNVAISLIKTQKDVQEMKEKMATKDDVNLILDRIDTFSKKVDVYDKRVVFHDYRFNELGPRVEDHEKRLLALESSR